MSGFILDKKAVITNVKPFLSNGYDRLFEAYKNSQNLTIPADFIYRNALRQLPNELNDFVKRVTGIKTWLDNSIGLIVTTDYSNQKLASELQGISDNLINTNNIMNINEFSSKIVDEGKVKTVENDILETTGAVIANKIETLTKIGLEKVKNMVGAIGKAIETVGASVAMATTSLVKGICQFGEALVDLTSIIATVIASVVTVPTDLVTSLLNSKLDFKNTASIWDETKAFVSKQHVQNSFKNFYENNLVGKWLANNSVSWLKPDSIGDGILSGIGYVAGVIGLSVATAGVGGVLTTGTTSMVTTSSVISGVAGVGKGTEKGWNEGLSVVNGLGFGLVNGAWEGLQYYIGGKVITGVGTTIGSKVIAKGGSQAVSKLATSATRVGLDAIDGAVETPVLSIVRNLFYNETLEESWNANGGIEGMLSNAAIGAIASSVSELKDLKSAVSSIKKEVAFDGKIRYDNQKFELSEQVLNSFKQLTEDQQVVYLNNCPINKLSALLDDQQLANEFSTLFDKRILESQDQFLLSIYQGNPGNEFKPAIEHIIANDKIIKELSNDNLITLLSEIDETKNSLIISEVNRRVDAGNALFDKTILSKSLFGMEFIDSYTAFNKLPEEIRKKITKLSLEMWGDLPPTIRKADLNFGNKFFQQASLASLYKKGIIDDDALQIVKSLGANGSKTLATFNFGLLDKNILNALGEDYVKEIGTYNVMSRKVISLYKNHKDLFEVFSKTVKNSKIDDSLSTFYLKTSACLDFIFENSDLLNNKNISLFENSDFINYILYTKNNYNGSLISKRVNLDFTPDYNAKFYDECDNIFANGYEKFNKNDLAFIKKMSLDDIKEAYFQKYFSISYREAQTFIAKYADHINEVSIYDTNLEVSTILEHMKKVEAIDINDATLLKQLYDNQQFRLNAEEMLSFDSNIKKIYSQSYTAKLTDTSLKINEMIDSKNAGVKKVLYNGKEVNVVSLKNDFSLLVYSSDTGFVDNVKPLINNSYIDSWNSNGAHAMSTSYITPENLGSAPVQNKGVLYGFTDINSESIEAMGPYDIGSNIDDYGFSAHNKQIFISADQMANNTTRVYNEIVIDRTKTKPNYIVLYTDATKEMVDNAMKSASEWDIPIIEINKVELVQSQLAKIDTLMKDFSNSKNITALKEALDIYESNVSGYRLNAINDGSVDYTSEVSNDSVANMFNSVHVENFILEYIDELKNTTNNSKQVEDLVGVLKTIQQRYDLANENGTKVITKTTSSFDIKSLIDLASEIKKG
ncbi:MAG: hypothetical protein RSB71_01485 [Bacilli bacterium]